jgi:hypothetical protein
MNDTGGYIEDNKNIDKIFSKIRSLEYLSGIILLLNGTVSRLTTNVKNALYRFKQQLPDEVYSNMIVIYTNIHDYSFSGDRDMKSLGLPSSCRCFFMQNSAFSLDPTQRQQKEIKDLTENFNESMETLKIIVGKLLSLESVSTSTFTDMDNDRNRIRGVLHEARLIVQQLQQMENELAILEQTSSSLESNIRRKELMLKDMPLRYVRMLEEVSTPYHNTLCMNCNQVCHEHCFLNETHRQGDQLLRCCQALRTGKCTACPFRCTYKYHYHARKGIRMVDRPFTQALNMRIRVDSERKDKDETDKQVLSIKEAKEAIDQQLHVQLVKVKDACLHVKQTCTSFNVAEELCSFIELLKTDNKTLTSELVKTKAQNFVEDLEQLCEDLNTDEISNQSPSGRELEEKEKNKDRETKFQKDDKGDHKTANVKREDSCEHGENESKSRKKEKYRGRDEPEASPTHSITPCSDRNLGKDRGEANQKSSIVQMSDNSSADANPKVRNETVCNRSATKAASKYLEKSTAALTYAQYSTEMLLDLYDNDSNEQANILEELRLRCEGRSIGYLAKNELLIFGKYFAENHQESVKRLFKCYDELREKIETFIKKDILMLKKIPTEKLIQLAVFRLLLDDEN